MIEAANSSAVCGIFTMPSDKDQPLDVSANHESKLSTELSGMTIEPKPMVNGDLKDSANWIPKSCKNATIGNQAQNVVV
ncbi:unnamed protein product [Heterobilharzia americana]|nr:unnamed protein product [Heterobilharzia americana]